MRKGSSAGPGLRLPPGPLPSVRGSLPSDAEATPPPALPGCRLPHWLCAHQEDFPFVVPYNECESFELVREEGLDEGRGIGIGENMFVCAVHALISLQVVLALHDGLPCAPGDDLWTMIRRCTLWPVREALGRLWMLSHDPDAFLPANECSILFNLFVKNGDLHDIVNRATLHLRQHVD